jgi:MoaA/NifB/PqqE/SkfB family radical SAM enzyme
VGPALAARIRDEADPFLVEVSLHGARAATHDRQTRVPGSFERLVANVGAMREAGLRVKLQAALTRWNEGEVEEMLDLAASLGAPLRFDPVVTPRDDGDLAPLELAASAEGRARLLEALRSRAEAAGPAPEAGLQGDDVAGPVPSTKHCGAGASTVAIDPWGGVFPCVQWRVPVGNLHEAGIREIWERSPALGGVRRENEAVRARLAEADGDARLLAYCPGIAFRTPRGR